MKKDDKITENGRHFLFSFFLEQQNDEMLARLGADGSKSA